LTRIVFAKPTPSTSLPYGSSSAIHSQGHVGKHSLLRIRAVLRLGIQILDFTPSAHPLRADFGVQGLVSNLHLAFPVANPPGFVAITQVDSLV
jgi:hypothetical protein